MVSLCPPPNFAPPLLSIQLQLPIAAWMRQLRQMPACAARVQGMDSSKSRHGMRDLLAY
jgi:hypothetical protein